MQNYAFTAFADTHHDLGGCAVDDCVEQTTPQAADSAYFYTTDGDLSSRTGHLNPYGADRAAYYACLASQAAAPEHTFTCVQ